jgi:hypothetical protein
MKSGREHQPQFPVRDYSHDWQRAVSWLGDRHLLATPIAPRSPDRKAQFLVDGARRWQFR